MTGASRGRGNPSNWQLAAFVQKADIQDEEIALAQERAGLVCFIGNVGRHKIKTSYEANKDEYGGCLRYLTKCVHEQVLPFPCYLPLSPVSSLALVPSPISPYFHFF